MNQWDVVLVIIALMGLIASVVGPITKLTKTISELSVNVGNLGDKVSQIAADNKERDRAINDHEKRIIKLEANEED